MVVLIYVKAKLFVVKMLKNNLLFFIQIIDFVT